MQTSLLSTFIVALILTSGKVTGESTNKGRRGIDAERKKRKITLNNNLRSRQANTARNGSIHRAFKVYEEWHNIDSSSDESIGHGKKKAILLKDSAIDNQKNFDTAKAKRFMSGCTDKKVKKGKQKRRTKKNHHGLKYQSWHDSDGKKYDCDYYAQDDNCVREGDDYENFGFTANQACCVCGGGNAINENLNPPIANSPLGVPFFTTPPPTIEAEMTSPTEVSAPTGPNANPPIANSPLGVPFFTTPPPTIEAEMTSPTEVSAPTGPNANPPIANSPLGVPYFTAPPPTIKAEMTSPTEASAPTGPNANPPIANSPLGVPLYR